MTGHAGIFAGGDMVPSERTVTIAVGHGKKAARTSTRTSEASAPSRAEKPPRRRVRRSAPLVRDRRRARRQAAHLGRHARSLVRRGRRSGSRERDALFEAKRCLSCGNCYECDGCLGACPSDAIIKLGKGKRYRFDYDRCTGCAVCFEQCPVHAIQMTPGPG